MRTTVTLDRDLEQILRETAARTLKPFKKVLNDTLRSAMARGKGPRPGHDPAGFSRLADDLEAEAFLETSRKRTDRDQ